MKTEEITIPVDAEIAQAYKSASAEERLKINSLINLKLRSATQSQLTLKSVMDEISRKAEERGLTPEVLDSLLNEE